MSNKKPLLEVFTICWEESDRLKQLIDFYRERVPDCLITVFDNMSTDNTEQVCKDNNVKHIQFDTNGKFDEQTLIDIRNNCWKDSDAKFIIVCDSDELVDVREMSLERCDVLKEWNVSKCLGINIVGHDKDFKDAKYGVFSDKYSKPILFYKEDIYYMNFFPGSHGAIPTPIKGKNIKPDNGSFKLYHTKWQDYESAMERNRLIRNKGLSDNNIENKWTLYYNEEDEKHKEYFDEMFNRRIKVR